MARFGILGGVGYALGGAVGVLLISLPFSVLVGGAIGGAALGLALGSWKKTIVLTLLSALGLTAGVLVALAIGSFFNYPMGLIGAIVGGLVGASVGFAFLDWRRMAVLAVSGSAGFAAGLLTGGLLRYSFPVVRGGWVASSSRD